MRRIVGCWDPSLRHKLFCWFVACCLGSSFTFLKLEIGGFQGIPGQSAVPEEVWNHTSGKAPKVFVGVLSAHEDRRKFWRKEMKCGEKLVAQGIPYRFIVGWPVDKGRDLTLHHQGGQASEEEARKAKNLRKESKKFGDLHFVHMPDMYLNLQGKTFALLDYGYRLGASYIMKMDDDMCVDGGSLLKGIRDHEASPQWLSHAFYGGMYKFLGTEYKSMKGRDAKTHSYFSGPCYLLSKDLVRLITQEDVMNSVLWATYGSFDEDAQTGRWVAYAEEEHHLKVKKKEVYGLCKRLNFPTTTSVPQGNTTKKKKKKKKKPKVSGTTSTSTAASTTSSAKSTTATGPMPTRGLTSHGGVKVLANASSTTSITSTTTL